MSLYASNFAPQTMPGQDQQATMAPRHQQMLAQALMSPQPSQNTSSLSGIADLIKMFPQMFPPEPAVPPAPTPAGPAGGTGLTIGAGKQGLNIPPFSMEQ
jgi:hypothetical protein